MKSQWLRAPIWLVLALGVACNGIDPEGSAEEAATVTPGAISYGQADGLFGAIRDVSVDAGGNVWATSSDTLYLLTPGATTFRAFTNADGLHVESFTAVDGSAATTTLTAVGGGAANVAYLGYYGYEGSADPFSDTDAQKHLGNGDKITYNPATGTISVLRYEFRCYVEHATCWEDRSVRRILVGKTGAAAGHVFWGFNHGTTHMFNDVMGDHVHPQVMWTKPDGTSYQRLGEAQSLALNPNGTLFIGSRYGVGLMNWNADPVAWLSAKFKIAFTTYSADHSLFVPEGYKEENRGAAITSDGTVWLASATKGLASWNQSTPISSLAIWGQTGGLPSNGIVDIVADTDDTLWLITGSRALVRFDPHTQTATATNIADARHLYVDATVSPRALYVARSTGLTVFR